MSKSKRIAVVINLDWTMKHHQEVFAGTQDYASAQGWESVLSPFPPELVDRKGDKLFDGIIARVHPELEERALDARIPLVNVWISSPCQNVPAVLPDIRAAGVMAGEHLIARGFRRLAYAGYSRARSSRWLQSGLREVGQKHEIKLVSLLVSSAFSDSIRSWEIFQERIRKWVASLQRPIGVVAINDKVARYLINAAMELGLSVPEEFAVVGMENEELVCLQPAPSISSIDFGWRTIGAQAGELLERMMDGGEAPPQPVLLPPGKLIPRKSTDSFQVDDQDVALALKFIADESHRPIKVRDVIDHVPVSWRSLERKFQECRQSTISAEITRFRMERAKRLLVETEMLIKQVAEACGFANSRRFCEVFKRTQDETPERYRKERVSKL